MEQTRLKTKSKQPTTIICLDSLEYDIVKKNNLNFYKQKHFGKLKVPITPGAGEPSTAVVWASFATGKNPEKHKIRYFNVYKNKFFNSIHRFIHLHSKLYDFVARLKISHWPKKLGLKKEAVSRKHIGRTFFDNYESCVISLPCYNEDAINYKIRKKLFDVLEKKMSEEEYERLLLKAFNNRIERFKKEINKHQLLCIHFFILDAIQHVYYYDDERVLWWYQFIASKLKPVLEQIKGKIFIISDHGQKRGMHTNHGFWSTNQKDIGSKRELRNLEKASITDFHKFI